MDAVQPNISIWRIIMTLREIFEQYYLQNLKRTSVRYTIWKRGQQQSVQITPTPDTKVAGHDNAVIPLTSVIDALMTDPVDHEQYNFRLLPIIS
jgi:hypothetical protein